MRRRLKNLLCRIFLSNAQLRLHECTDRALYACELIVAVKHCMMFSHIHADWSVKEVLDKHGADSVQALAKMAQDTAEDALKLWKELSEP